VAYVGCVDVEIRTHIVCIVKKCDLLSSKFLGNKW